MFAHTMPVVAMALPLQPLPRSHTATSFWLPKMAEQGLGVPVRELDDDYLPAVQARLNDLLQEPASRQKLSAQVRNSMRGLVVEENTRVQHIIPVGGLMLTNHELDGNSTTALLDLLLFKDLHQLDPAVPPSPYGKTATLTQNDVPYLRLLASLEHMGIIDGIVYEYDVPAAQGYQDIRRIIVDARTLHQEHDRGALDRDHVIHVLNSGMRIDADAAPLRDFIDEALAGNGVASTKRLSRTARFGVTPKSAQRRPHDVMLSTIIEGR